MNGELLVDREGAAGRITLNRPGALNALTLDMLRGIDAGLDAFEVDPEIASVVLAGAGGRAFSAGGDIRALYETRAGGPAFARTFWREEYRLDRRIAEYPKPVVAVMDGVVMGGGMGISAHARHRIVTDATQFAMPECGIGFMPDVGATWLLPRAPGELGAYLALTGERIGPADAIHAGVADAFVPRANLPVLFAALATGGPPDEALRKLARVSDPPPLAEKRGEIDALFAGDDIEAIVERLAAAGTDFAARTAATLAQKSPTSLKLTLSAQRRGRELGSLSACLDMEYRVVCRLFEGHDFHEGIRAAVIDKDRQPRWWPAKIEEVSEAMVEAHFAPLGPDELGLAAETRQ